MGEKINADVYAAHGLHSAEEISRHSHPSPHQRGTTQNLKTDQRQQHRLDNVVAIDAAHGIHNFDVYWSAPEAGHMIHNVRPDEQQQYRAGGNAMGKG